MQLPGLAIERAVGTPMRDGCRLVADIYRLDDGARARPVLVLRTPYGRGFGTQANLAHPAWYARHGFIVVVQDVRGRHDSDGTFEPFANEAADGHDTIEWAAGLEGSSGRVGTYGASYAGYAQLLAAATRPPSLGAICPAISAFDLRCGMLFTDGVFEVAFAAWWAASLALESARRSGSIDLDRALRRLLAAAPGWYGSAAPARLLPDAPETSFYRSWLEHRSDDAWWDAVSARAQSRLIDVPALHVTGWWDAFLDGALDAYATLRDRDDAAEQTLLVGPWSHVPWGARIGDRDFGDEAERKVVDEAQVAFLRRHLAAGAAPAPRPPVVRYFVLGENAWRDATDWPPTPARTHAWRLDSDGDAASVGGTGRLLAEDSWDAARAGGADLFAYDAASPVPSLGGRSCCFPEASPIGPHDQAFIEQRRDVLVYTSEPLGNDLLVAGPVSVRVWMASDAPTADIVARLCVVEDRRSSNLVEGICRIGTGGWPSSGFRRVDIELGSTAVRIAAGARLRLHVTAGSFPRFEINPQAEVPAEDAAPSDRRAATFALAHDASHVSDLRLRAVVS